MLTQKAATPPAPASGARPLDPSTVCYFQGALVPLSEARISVMTHGFLYGTATFEGIRGYWNDEQEQLYGLRLREHYRRLTLSGRVLLMEPRQTVDELVALTVE